MKIMKAQSASDSKKTYYYNVKVPAGVLTQKEGCFSGASSKPEAEIGEIGWVYCFGKKFFKITHNGKNKLEDYRAIIEKYADQ